MENYALSSFNKTFCELSYAFNKHGHRILTYFYHNREKMSEKYLKNLEKMSRDTMTNSTSLLYGFGMSDLGLHYFENIY